MFAIIIVFLWLLECYTGHSYHLKLNPRDINTKTKYRTTIIPPIPLVICHLNARIARNTKISITKSIVMEHAAPALETPRGCWLTAVHKIQGSGKLKNNHAYVKIVFQSCTGKF